LDQGRTSTPGRMTEMFHKVAQISLLLILSFSISAVAQLNVAKQAPTNVPNGPLDTTFRIATINMQQTIIASNEGRRDFEALSLKFQPKEAELKRFADEIDGLKKQLNAQQSMADAFF